MPKRKLADTSQEHEHEIELKLAYMNVGQTVDMWTGMQADDHQQRFSRTVQTVMVSSEIDILWLCEVGSHPCGLSESELSPKQVLQRNKQLNDVADVIDDLGPYLILVRKNRGICLLYTSPSPRDRG